MTKLTDVCDIQYGYAFDSKCFSNDETLPPLVRIRDVKRGYSETFYSGEYPEEYIIHAGDLLVGMDGEFNIARWKSRDALLNQRVCKIVAKDGTNEEYIRFFLSTTLKEIEKRTSFVTVKHLSAKELNKIEINIPNINEQTRIAISLRTLENIITHRRTQLEKLDLLVKARFVEMFGDPNDTSRDKEKRHKIGELCDVTKLAGFEFTEYINYQDSGEIIMLRGLNCKQGKLILDNVKYIDRETSHKLPRSRLYIGDILMTYAGTIGDVAMVDENDKYHLAPNVAKISIINKKKLSPVFLVHLFMYSHDYIMSFVSQVAQASINMQKIRNFEYAIPSIEEQYEFEKFVQQVDKSRFITLKENKESEIL